MLTFTESTEDDPTRDRVNVPVTFADVVVTPGTGDHPDPPADAFRTTEKLSLSP